MQLAASPRNRNWSKPCPPSFSCNSTRESHITRNIQIFSQFSRVLLSRRLVLSKINPFTPRVFLYPDGNRGNRMDYFSQDFGFKLGGIVFWRISLRIFLCAKYFEKKNDQVSQKWSESIRLFRSFIHCYLSLTVVTHLCGYITIKSAISWRKNYFLEHLASAIYFSDTDG